MIIWTKAIERIVIKNLKFDTLDTVYLTICMSRHPHFKVQCKTQNLFRKNPLQFFVATEVAFSRQQQGNFDRVPIALISPHVQN